MIVDRSDYDASDLNRPHHYIWAFFVFAVLAGAVTYLISFYVVQISAPTLPATAVGLIAGGAACQFKIARWFAKSLLILPPFN